MEKPNLGKRISKNIVKQLEPKNGDTIQKKQIFEIAKKRDLPKVSDVLREKEISPHLKPSVKPRDLTPEQKYQEEEMLFGKEIANKTSATQRLKE